MLIYVFSVKWNFLSQIELMKLKPIRPRTTILLMSQFFFIFTYPLKKLRVEHGSANQEHESMRSENENHGQHFNSGHALKVKLVRLYVKDFLNVLNDGKHQYNLVDSARLLPSGPFDGVRYGLFLSLNVDEMEKSRQHDQH